LFRIFLGEAEAKIREAGGMRVAELTLDATLLEG
jgi:hypothetical protein